MPERAERYVATRNVKATSGVITQSLQCPMQSAGRSSRTSLQFLQLMPIKNISERHPENIDVSTQL